MLSIEIRPIIETYALPWIEIGSLATIRVEPTWALPVLSTALASLMSWVRWPMMGSGIRGLLGLGPGGRRGIRPGGGTFIVAEVHAHDVRGPRLWPSGDMTLLLAAGREQGARRRVPGKGRGAVRGRAGSPEVEAMAIGVA